MAVPLSQVSASEPVRWPTGLLAVDQVLGGGLVPGSVILLGGEPGVGKSTLLLQLWYASSGAVLYVTAEEPPTAIRQRADRIGIRTSLLRVLAESDLAHVSASVAREQPALLLLDSIQTVHLDDDVPGTVPTVQRCGQWCVRLAREQGVTVILTCHVTKEGQLAGPKALQHLVDVVLNLEGVSEPPGARLLSATKNRYGPTERGQFLLLTSKGFV